MKYFLEIIIQNQKPYDRKQFFLKFLIFYIIPSEAIKIFFDFDLLRNLLPIGFSIIFFNICLKYLNEYKDDNLTFKSFTFLIFILIAFIPFYTIVFSLLFLILLISPEANIFNFLIKHITLVIGIVIINSCVLPLQIILPGYKVWRLFNDSYETYIIDETNYFSQQVITAKKKLPISESLFHFELREYSSRDNYFAPYSIEINSECENPNSCDYILPGEKLKLIKKYFYKNVGITKIFNSDTQFYVAVDKVGRQIELREIQLTDFTKPVKFNGNNFKFVGNFYNDQEALVAEISNIVKNKSAVGENRIIQIFNNPNLSLKSSLDIFKIFLNNKIIFSEKVYQSLLSSKKIEDPLRFNLANKLSNKQMEKIINLNTADKNTFDPIFDVILKSNDVKKLKFIEMILFSNKLSSLQVEHFTHSFISSDSKLKFNDELIYKILNSPETTFFNRKSMIEFIIKDYKEFQNPEKLLRKMRKLIDQHFILTWLDELKNAYDVAPEYGAFIHEVLISKKKDAKIENKIKEILPVFKNGLLYSNEIQKILKLNVKPIQINTEKEDEQTEQEDLPKTPSVPTKEISQKIRF